MKWNWLLLLGVISLASLIIYRSHVIPFTHDEASTWLNYRHLNVWSCISNPACWGTANNHWLNTLLLQWSGSLFGESSWALRLPNVLAGVAYLIAAALLSIRYIKNNSLQCAGFLMLCCHPYLLDFFSLARGYGLMVSGVIWGIYAVLRYVENYHWRWLAICIVALTMAILSNFTGLLPWAAIGCGWVMWIVINKKWVLLFRHGLSWFVNAAFLLLLLRFPIKTLAGSGEFDWGSANVWEMAKDLMVNLLYGARYVGDLSSVYLLTIFMAGIMIIICAVLFTKKQELRPSIIFILLLLGLNVCMIFLEQKITGSLAPVGRKSIYLIPFIFCVYVFGISMIQNIKFSLGFSVLFSVVFALHLMHTLPMRSCREWYYDAYYPELISTLFPSGSGSDSLRLGTSWIFNPALQFYQKTIPLPVSGLVYQKPLIPDSTMQYYYVESQDTIGMRAKGFVIEKRIGPFLLLKNTNPDTR